MSTDQNMPVQSAPRPNTLAALIKEPAYANRFKEALGPRAPQFVSSLLSVGNTMKDVEPKSILASAMIAATLDLPIEKNLGFAWIVPYREGQTKFAQFQMGWKGFVQLAYRSGQYKNLAPPRSINAEAFSGYDSIGLPIIDWNLVDETKPAVGYAFAWRLVNGGESVFFWPLAKVKAHAERYSQAYRSGKGSPWTTHFPEMAKKTVVKNSLSQFGALSVQMQTALLHDQSVMKDVDAEPNYIDAEPAEPIARVELPPPMAVEAAAPTDDVPYDAKPQAPVAPPRGRKSKAETKTPTTAETPPEANQEPAADPLGPATEQHEELLKRLQTDNMSVDHFINWATKIGLAAEGTTDIREISSGKLALLLKPGSWPSYAAQIKLANAAEMRG